MKTLREEIRESIDRDSDLIRKRVTDFLSFRKAEKEELFGELCFCILAANTSAEMGIRVQNAIGNRGFLEMEPDELRSELNRIRCRFYNNRSRFIVEAREIADDLPEIVNSENTEEARDELVRRVKGIGYKESSHFLRNVGTFDFAILDKHIVGMISRDLGIEPIKSFSRKKYMEMEGHFKDLAREFNLKPGVLDLHMWKIATGKVLK